MSMAKISGLLDKADKMGWFFLDEHTFENDQRVWNSSLEIEKLKISDEKLRWSRADWYSLFVIPLSKVLEKRGINKSEIFVYLKFVDQMSISDISSIFKTSSYLIASELLYFLMKDSSALDCECSISGSQVSLSILDEKFEQPDYHRGCQKCENIEKTCLKSIYEFKKRVISSNKTYFDHMRQSKLQRKKLKLSRFTSLFS